MMGAVAPPARDEAACNKTTCHITSKKSLPKTAMAGRHPHRAVRYYGRIGFTSHQRELLHGITFKPVIIGKYLSSLGKLDDIITPEEGFETQL